MQVFENFTEEEESSMTEIQRARYNKHNKRKILALDVLNRFGTVGVVNPLNKEYVSTSIDQTLAATVPIAVRIFWGFFRKIDFT